MIAKNLPVDKLNFMITFEKLFGEPYTTESTSFEEHDRLYRKSD